MFSKDQRYENYMAKINSQGYLRGETESLSVCFKSDRDIGVSVSLRFLRKKVCPRITEILNPFLVNPFSKEKARAFYKYFLHNHHDESLSVPWQHKCFLWK